MRSSPRATAPGAGSSEAPVNRAVVTRIRSAGQEVAMVRLLPKASDGAAGRPVKGSLVFRCSIRHEIKLFICTTKFVVVDWKR